MKSTLTIKTNFFAAIIFLALAIWEAYNDLKGIPRAGFTANANIVGVFLVPLWLTCAVSLFIRLYQNHWRTLLVTMGILACFMHGAVLRVGRATVPGYSGGALMIGSGALLLLLFAPSIKEWLVARGLVSSRDEIRENLPSPL